MPKVRLRSIAGTILLLALLAGLFLAPRGERSSPPEDLPAELDAVVTRAIDGDTVEVRIGGRLDEVRYIGIDTPESVKPGSPVECMGRAASTLNAGLVRGQRVLLELDAEERDRYGRLLAYVRRARDGLFVNAELVRRGYATQLSISPNVRYAERFRALAAEARAAHRGLWRLCPTPANG